MVQLTCFGGVGEIGGNKFLLQGAGGQATFLDFGMSFSLEKQFFSEFMKARSHDPIPDLTTLGMLPKEAGSLLGLYRTDFYEMSAAEADGTPHSCNVKEVYISHAHADHVSYAKYLHPRIPLIAGVTTAEVLRTLGAGARGTSAHADILDYSPRYEPRRSRGRVSRRLMSIDQGHEFALAGGEFWARLYGTDHSMPGATGILLEEEQTGKRIVYTGDLRAHGRKAGGTHRFIQEAAKFRPDLLICEGTNLRGEGAPDEMGADYRASEQEVAADLVALLESRPGDPFLFCCSARDLDRMTSFKWAADQTGRTLVVDLKVYRLWEALSNLGEYPVDLASLRIYLPKKSVFGYDSTEYFGNIREFLEDEDLGPQAITAEDIRSSPQSYLTYVPKWDLVQLISLDLPAGFTYVWSETDPYDPEGEVGEARFQAWVSRFSGRVEKIHCSGHATPAVLLDFVNRIRPARLLPVHTECPQAWETLGLDPSIEIMHATIGRAYDI
jgi:ribonuclease J